MKVETKFNLGDKVWIIDGNKIKECVIMSVTAHQIIECNLEISYGFESNDEILRTERDEDKVFATKQELLNLL